MKPLQDEAKTTDEIRKYRKEICQNCGGDCDMSPKHIRECEDLK